MRRIVIINQACGNRGDEAAHKAFVKGILGDGRFAVSVVTIGVAEQALSSMKVPGAEYVNISPGRFYYKWTAGALKKGLGFLWVLSGTAHRVAREMKKADVLVCAPGGMDLGGFRNWHHLFLMRMALRFAPKVAYFGRSIGPFVDDRFSSLSSAVLYCCGFISLRDTKSWALGDRLGLEWHKMLDIVFADGKLPVSGKPFAGDAGYCVLVPNSLRWHPAFRQLTEASGSGSVESFFVSVIQGISKRFPDIRIVMLPQLFGAPGLNQGDVEFFHRIADAAGMEGKLCVLPDTLDSDTQRSVVAGAEFLVGARYHSIVFAASAGVPFLSLTYEDKMKGLVENFRLPSVAEYDLRGGLNSTAVMDLLDGMSLSRYGDSPQLAAARSLTCKCFDEFKEWMAE